MLIWYEIHFMLVFIETFAFEDRVTDQVVEMSMNLIPKSESKAVQKRPTPEEIRQSIEKVSEKFQENIDLYEQLVTKLCDAIEEQSSLHWRHSNLALCMLTTLTRYV